MTEWLTSEYQRRIVERARQMNEMKTLTEAEYSKLWWEQERRGQKAICPTCRAMDGDCKVCNGQGWVIRLRSNPYGEGVPK